MCTAYVCLPRYHSLGSDSVNKKITKQATNSNLERKWNILEIIRSGHPKRFQKLPPKSEKRDFQIYPKILEIFFLTVWYRFKSLSFNYVFFMLLHLLNFPKQRYFFFDCFDLHFYRFLSIVVQCFPPSNNSKHQTAIILDKISYFEKIFTQLFFKSYLKHDHPMTTRMLTTHTNIDNPQEQVNA